MDDSSNLDTDATELIDFIDRHRGLKSEIPTGGAITSNDPHEQIAQFLDANGVLAPTVKRMPVTETYYAVIGMITCHLARHFGITETVPVEQKIHEHFERSMKANLAKDVERRVRDVVHQRLCEGVGSHSNMDTARSVAGEIVNESGFRERLIAGLIDNEDDLVAFFGSCDEPDQFDLGIGLAIANEVFNGDPEALDTVEVYLDSVVNSRVSAKLA